MNERDRDDTRARIANWVCLALALTSLLGASCGGGGGDTGGGGGNSGNNDTRWDAFDWDAADWA